MSTKKEQATYSHGHHTTVTTDHARRGAADSAGFVIPHIKPNFTILDVGCGPGTITADLATLVPQGKVIGVDFSESVINQARENAASRRISNVEFQQMDANELPFEENTFDVVFCHQVLQHVGSPVSVLTEMRRVAKPGGFVAAREADYGSFSWYPEPPLVKRWQELYLSVARANGGEPNAGRYVHVWAQEAGFKHDEIEATWDAWRYADERAKQFSESHGGRILQPGFLGTAIKTGLATEDEIKQISKAWLEWGVQENVFIAIPSGQILCRKG